MNRYGMVAVILASTTLGLAGCGASRPPVPTATQLEALPTVSVTVDPGLDADRIEAFERNDGVTQLHNGVVAELVEAGKGRNVGKEIQLLVTRFRLRSTGSGLWLGVMAGADILDVSVTVVDESGSTRTFETGAAGIAAGILKASASGRFNGLVEAVAERVVKEL